MRLAPWMHFFILLRSLLIPFSFLLGVDCGIALESAFCSFWGSISTPPIFVLVILLGLAADWLVFTFSNLTWFSMGTSRKPRLRFYIMMNKKGAFD